MTRRWRREVNDRMDRAVYLGYRIDEIFRNICYRRGLDPHAAMTAGPLLSIALADSRRGKNGRAPPRSRP